MFECRVPVHGPSPPSETLVFLLPYLTKQQLAPFPHWKRCPTRAHVSLSLWGFGPSCDAMRMLGLWPLMQCHMHAGALAPHAMPCACWGLGPSCLAKRMPGLRPLMHANALNQRQGDRWAVHDQALKESMRTTARQVRFPIWDATP